MQIFDNLTIADNNIDIYVHGGGFRYKIHGDIPFTSPQTYYSYDDAVTAAFLLINS